MGSTIFVNILLRATLSQVVKCFNQETIQDFFLFVCTTVLYEYMNLIRNDVFSLFVNTHVQIKIYREFYHSIICSK